MQLFVNGLQRTYVLDLDVANASLVDLRSQIAELEGCEEEMTLFVAGRPLDETVDLASLAGTTVDVNVPLKGGKVRAAAAKHRGRDVTLVTHFLVF